MPPGAVAAMVAASAFNHSIRRHTMELITRLRLPLAVPVALLVAALFAVGSASAAPKTVNGTVGPGFTISLKRGSKNVTRLAPTTYRFKVTDKSSIHDFHLSGPGVNKVITGIGFKGTKTVTIKLRKGVYRYRCDPHSGEMHGSFKVG
jgi:plastocyanin